MLRYARDQTWSSENICQHLRSIKPEHLRAWNIDGGVQN